jgi:hypothetical protein
MAEEVIKEQPQKNTIALPTNVMGVSDFAETQTYFPDTKEDSTTEQILNVRKALQKDIGYAVTFDESKQIYDSNYDPLVINKVTNTVKKRLESNTKYSQEGNDINLAADSFFKVRDKIAKIYPDEAKNIKYTDLINNFKKYENFIDGEDIVKLEGIENKGAPIGARTAFSFAAVNDKNILNQAEASLVFSLDEKTRKKYFDLNYAGPPIVVLNSDKFADGQKRIVYKIPKELGGDDKFNVFNNEGVDFKDLSSYTGEILPFAAEIIAGIKAAPTGPAGVAIATGLSGGVAEMTKLLIGQAAYGVNQDMTLDDIVIEGMKRAAVTGGLTYVSFPVLNGIARVLKTKIPESIAEKTGIGGNVLGRKVLEQTIDAYKKGLNKDELNEVTINKLREKLLTSKEEGGPGLSEDAVNLLINKTFQNNLPGTNLSVIDELNKVSPQGVGMKKAPLVGEKGQTAVRDAEKESLKIIDNVFQENLGISPTKIDKDLTLFDVFDPILKDADVAVQNNIIKNAKFDKKYQEAWKKLTQDYTVKLNPEAQNFNTVIQDLINPINKQAYAEANSISKILSDKTSNIKVTIPKTASPGIPNVNKTLDDSISSLEGQIKQAQKIKSKTGERVLNNLEEAKIILEQLKGQYKAGKSFNFQTLENSFDLLDNIAAENPTVNQPVKKLLVSLRNARSESINKLPKEQADEIIKLQNRYSILNSTLKDDVLGQIVDNLSGVKGSVANAKALSTKDQFNILFGNSQEQLYATNYLGNYIKSEGSNLIKPQADQLKKVMFQKFIDDVSPDNPNAIPIKKWMEKYQDAYANILNKEEMKKLTSIQNARSGLEFIEINAKSLNQKAREAFPSILQKTDIDDINPFIISNALFDPKVTPKQVNAFFGSINKEQKELVKTFYLKQVFDQSKKYSPILDRETLDGSKLLQYFDSNGGAGEQVFANIFGKDQLKNMKTVAAALDFMQNSSSYIGKTMTKAEADQVRNTATRMVYGPLSHENLFIKGVLFFAEKLDKKLGKELLDYDYFVESFKNSYAFKYAPALNDKKYLGLFNQYDSGLTQQRYTGTVAGISGEGGQEARKEYFMEDYGQPNIPILRETYGLPKTVVVDAPRAFKRLLKDLSGSEGESVREKLTAKEKKGIEQLKERIR